MHSLKWTPPLWLLMLGLASRTTGWMSDVSSRRRVKPDWVASSCHSKVGKYIFGKHKERKHACARSSGDQLVSSVSAGVHNVLLLRYIFITMMCVCLGQGVRWNPPTPPHPIERRSLGMATAEEGTAASECSQPLSAARLAPRSVYFQQGRLIRASSCQRFVSAPLLSPQAAPPRRESGAKANEHI